MHKSFGVVLVAWVWVLPRVAMSQVALDSQDDLDALTSRPQPSTPTWVEELEGRAGVPRCDDAGWWGRSTLDGGLASRTRPEGLPCRSIWESTVRLEIGIVAGGLFDRGDGGLGGLSLSLGLRYHEYLSVYYQLHLLGGAWERGGGVTVDAAAWNAVLLEFSPHRHFAVAAGPAFDVTAGCDFDVGQEPTSCTYAWSYGVAARLTVPLAQVDSTGIVATGDFHVSLIEPEPRTVALLGVGFRQ